MTRDRSHHAKYFNLVRIYLNLTFRRYMWKTTVWPLCSIFSNGGHVFQWIKNPHTSSMQDTPRNIYAKFGSNLSSSFRGEEFCIIVNNDDDSQWRRQWTPSDGNSSRGLRPGELKMSNPYKQSNYDYSYQLFHFITACRI